MELFTKTVPLNISDEALIEQFKRGDMDAFHALYHRHFPAVHRRAGYLVPTEDVDDVTQEIFIAVLRSLPKFRGDSQFSTWLWTLCNHKIAEFYRKHRRKQDPQVVHLAEAAGRTEGHTPEFLEDWVFMMAALLKLPRKYREIILLRFVEDMPFHEIAEFLGQSIEAVKSLHRRAIAALKKHLQEETPDDLHEEDK